MARFRKLENVAPTALYNILDPEDGSMMAPAIQAADARTSDWPDGAEAYPIENTEFEGRPADVAR